MKEKKMFVLGFFFLFGNMLSGSLIKTGAFEIILNDKLIYSNLESGRSVPSVQDVLRLIKDEL